MFNFLIFDFLLCDVIDFPDERDISQRKELTKFSELAPQFSFYRSGVIFSVRRFSERSCLPCARRVQVFLVSGDTAPLSMLSASYRSSLSASYQRWAWTMFFLAVLASLCSVLVLGTLVARWRQLCAVV